MKQMIFAAALFSAACNGSISTDTDPVTDNETAASDCRIHSPKDVTMWINAMPGPNATPTLIATFSATAPTPGYTFALKTLEVRESYPPQYVFDLVATPPAGIVSQVETETDIWVEIQDFADSEIASATVMCGGTPLFELDSVETAY